MIPRPFGRKIELYGAGAQNKALEIAKTVNAKKTEEEKETEIAQATETIKTKLLEYTLPLEIRQDLDNHTPIDEPYLICESTLTDVSGLFGAIQDLQVDTTGSETTYVFSMFTGTYVEKIDNNHYKTYAYEVVGAQTLFNENGKLLSTVGVKVY